MFQLKQGDLFSTRNVDSGLSLLHIFIVLKQNSKNNYKVSYFPFRKVEDIEIDNNFKSNYKLLKRMDINLFNKSTILQEGDDNFWLGYCYVKIKGNIFFGCLQDKSFNPALYLVNKDISAQYVINFDHISDLIKNGVTDIFSLTPFLPEEDECLGASMRDIDLSWLPENPFILYDYIKLDGAEMAEQFMLLPTPLDCISISSRD